MSITFSTDLPRPTATVESPCLCAQMGDGFIRMMRGEDSAEIRADLAKEARPDCPHCQGTGVESVPVENPNTLNMNDNGFRLLAALGLGCDSYGECSFADARRALVRARNTDLTHLVRAEETVYGAPRTNDDGTVELRPIRVFGSGLSLEGLQRRIEAFDRFVRDASAAGATRIFWS